MATLQRPATPRTCLSLPLVLLVLLSCCGSREERHHPDPALLPFPTDSILVGIADDLPKAPVAFLLGRGFAPDDVAITEAGLLLVGGNGTDITTGPAQGELIVATQQDHGFTQVSAIELRTDTLFVMDYSGHLSVLLLGSPGTRLHNTVGLGVRGQDFCLMGDTLVVLLADRNHPTALLGLLSREGEILSVIDGGYRHKTWQVRRHFNRGALGCLADGSGFLIVYDNLPLVERRDRNGLTQSILHFQNVGSVPIIETGASRVMISHTETVGDADYVSSGSQILLGSAGDGYVLTHLLRPGAVPRPGSGWWTLVTPVEPSRPERLGEGLIHDGYIIGFEGQSPLLWR